MRQALSGIGGLAALGLIFGVLPGCNFGQSSVSTRKPPPPTVTVGTPVRGPVDTYGEYVGQLAAPQTVELRARVDGFVKDIPFKEGSIVEQGALLIQIDPAPYEVALQSAEAQQKVAQAALEQAKNVKDIEVNQANVARAQATENNAAQQVKDNQIAFSKGAVSREALDNAVTAEKQAAASLESAKQTLAQSQADYQTRVAQANAQVAVAEAAVAAAKLNLGYTRVTAPIRGRIGASQVHIGSLVQAAQGTLLATLSQTDPIWIYFSISEREEFELHKLYEEKKLGGIDKTPVDMILADGSIYPHRGVLNFADRALDPNTGTLTLRAVFPNPGEFLRPGNYGRVRMLLIHEDNALLIPEVAIGSDQAGEYVYVVNPENVVERRGIKSGVHENQMAQVLEGLSDHDRIVFNGLQRARPGLQVAPVPDTTPHPLPSKTPLPEQQPIEASHSSPSPAK